MLQYFCTFDNNYFGNHYFFWVYKFPREIPDGELQQTLNTLSQHPLVKSINHDQYQLALMLSTLLERAFTALGDQIEDAQLLDWLMIGMDEHGSHHLKNGVIKYEKYQAVTDWINTHPERYQGLLHAAYQQAAQYPEPTRKLFVYDKALAGFTPPPNMATWHLEQFDKTTHPDLKKEHLYQAVSSLEQGSASTLTLKQLEQWAANDANKQAMLAPYLQRDLHENLLRRIQESNKHSDEERNTDKASRTEELKPLLPAIQQGTAPNNIMGLFAKLWNGTTRYAGENPAKRLKSYCNEPEATQLKQAIEEGMPLCVQRDDLPSIKEIIELYIQRKHYFIQPACLLCAELIWGTDPHQLLELSEPTLQTLACFLLTSHESLKDTTWFLGLSKTHLTLVANVFITLGKACFKAKIEHVPCLNELLYAMPKNLELHAVAQHCILPLLDVFPTRANSTQLPILRNLLHTAQQLNIEGFSTLITKKLKRRSLDVPQITHWLLAGLSLAPAQYENALLEHIQRSNQHLMTMHTFCFSSVNYTPPDNIEQWSTHFIGQLIELSSPYVQKKQWSLNTIAPVSTLDWDCFTRTLIHELTQRTHKDSITELERLLALQSTSTLHDNLREALHTAQEEQREQSFKFLELHELGNILNNQKPVNAADLHTLTLACLDDIANDIRTSNSDIFRQFWNEEHNKPRSHKDENSCRDALLELLKHKLNPLGVSCEPEGDYFNNKRADIRLSVGPNISIPIEIKGEWHKDLWSAVQNQLIPQYTQEKASAGFGIYVVLWVGGTEQPNPKDGGKRAITREELEKRLRQHSIPIEKKALIKVRVLDISWPT